MTSDPILPEATVRQILYAELGYHVPTGTSLWMAARRIETATAEALENARVGDAPYQETKTVEVHIGAERDA